MKYCRFYLKATPETIKEKTKSLKLKEFHYETGLAAVNIYMIKTLRNDICFIAYNDRETTIPAVFSFNDRKDSFEDAFSQITDALTRVFSVKKFSEPCEITTFQFYDCYEEAKRRDLVGSFSSWVFDLAHLESTRSIKFENELEKFHFREEILAGKPAKNMYLLDESVKKELTNIENCENVPELNCNMAHYFISGKSFEGCLNIAETVGENLLKAGRLSGRRMVIFNEIATTLYKSWGIFDEVIKNNCGGIIVIDTKERLGCPVTEYGAACKFIENIFKENQNDCVFMFTYNPDDPGFAFELLKLINKHVIMPLTLKEGTGSRAEAVKYLKSLVKNSKYAEYVSQTSEFMKLFPGNEFSRTDILYAFERFGSWCLNKNVLHSDYNFSSDSAFMLDRDDNGDRSYEKLRGLVGLASVKEQIDKIIASDIVEKERKKRVGRDYETTAMHMVFSGNPGTAKTTVAKLFAGIAREKGILKSGAFVCIGGNEIFPTTLDNAFKQAEGGVLFIDEAYALDGFRSITLLLQKMEENRDSVIVILAGYKDAMNEFLERNDGLRSRIPYIIDFPDYSVEELTEIFRNMVKERGFEIEEEAVKKAHMLFEKARCIDNFGNGRYVRNLLDGALQNQSVRLVKSGKAVDSIRKKDLFLIKTADIDAVENDVNRTDDKGSAQKELDEMVGLQSVKDIMRKIVANAKLRKICSDKGIAKENPSLHMMFTGNPGTAKTTVARLLARIMKDEKILPTGNFVEVGRADLVAKYVGHTAPLVKQKFKEAQGGVLFIDEAYSLCDDRENSFGDEAINTIVREMENHRGDVIVIFAGYADKMNAFIERNPGMRSRIKYKVNFEDYTAEELCEITKLMLEKKQMTITDPAMEKLKNIYENARTEKSFGNGRFVREMLEEAKMNLAERLSDLDGDALNPQLITTLEEADIPAEADKKADERKHIGF